MMVQVNPHSPPRFRVNGPLAKYYGLPEDLHARYRDRFFAIPMMSTRVRSLNLSTSVGIAVYETLRQRRAK